MLPQRKHPIHLPASGGLDRPTIIFVTACTAGRRPILARTEVLPVILAAWQQADEWRVGRYVIMPDHVHLFCAPSSALSPPLEKWMQFWKSLVTRQWPWPAEKPIWQRDHWDRELRREESYADKWEYVRLNPVRRGLVAPPDDWPYQGEVNTLRW